MVDPTGRCFIALGVDTVACSMVVVFVVVVGVGLYFTTPHAREAIITTGLALEEAVKDVQWALSKPDEAPIDPRSGLSWNKQNDTYNRAVELLLGELGREVLTSDERKKIHETLVSKAYDQLTTSEELLDVMLEALDEGGEALQEEIDLVADWVREKMGHLLNSGNPFLDDSPRNDPGGGSGNNPGSGNTPPSSSTTSNSQSIYLTIKEKIFGSDL